MLELNYAQILETFLLHLVSALPETPLANFGIPCSQQQRKRMTVHCYKYMDWVKQLIDKETTEVHLVLLVVS